MTLSELTRSSNDDHSQADPKSLFQWTKQWYPVAVAEYLDPSRPHSIELLGKKLVLWRDSTQKWHCFEDACPHRLVPLSQGRIEPDDTLLCSYHAWRFQGDGKCVSIPQSVDTTTEERNCNREKACATVYPLQEKQGLLWVWGESGSQALQDSQLKQPAIIPEVEEKSEKVLKFAWNIRDLPYGWDFFIENVTDPAHVPVSHHGLMGSRYTDAKYYDMLPIRSLSTDNGFSFSVTSSSPNIESSITDFQPPSHVRVVTTFVDEGKLILALYAVPTRPGWCRHIGCQVLVKNKEGKNPPGLAFFALPMPIWLNHILASLFLHQDLVFLHHQEQYMNQMTDDWLNGVYTPNPQDKMVITFRQWLKDRAGGKIPWFGSPSPAKTISSQQLFDVYTTHTQNCRYCQTALKRIETLSVACYIVAGILGILAIWLDIRYLVEQTMLQDTVINHLAWMTPPHVVLCLVFALVIAIKGYLWKRLSRLFYSYKFEHFRND